MLDSQEDVLLFQPLPEAQSLPTQSPQPHTALFVTVPHGGGFVGEQMHQPSQEGW